jgi:hypothetical protein
MAIFPQGLPFIEQRCSTAERRLLRQLRRSLDDDYLIWFATPIGPEQCRPDFIILSPRWGLLLLEVRDWTRQQIRRARRDQVVLASASGQERTELNPLHRLRRAMMGLVELMQQDPSLVRGSGAFRGKLLFPYGWGLALPHQPRPDPTDPMHRGESFPDRFVLWQNDLDDQVPAHAFAQRLWGMSTVHYPGTLTLQQRDRIRWHLHPEVRVHSLLGDLDTELGEEDDDETTDFSPPVDLDLDFDLSPSPIRTHVLPRRSGQTVAAALDGLGITTPRTSSLPELMQVLDLRQEQVARTLAEGHWILHGSAGSGKTMILLFRARQLQATARPERPVLVLCHNRVLANRIEALLLEHGADNRIQVRTFHGWCEDLVLRFNLDVSVDRRAVDYLDALVRTTERALESGFIPVDRYTAILVDEGHEFEATWLKMISSQMPPDQGHLLVLYDDAQSPFQRQRRRFSFASVGIQAEGHVRTLRVDYRNTHEIQSVAARLAHQLLVSPDTGLPTAPGTEPMPLLPPASCGRRGTLPMLLDARDAETEAMLIADRVWRATTDGVPAGDIAILVRAKFLMPPIEKALIARGLQVQSMGDRGFQHFDWAAPAVRLLTMQAARGLEFPSVIVAGLQSMPRRSEPLDEEIRLLYIAMTRATQELLLATHDDSPMVQRVRDAIEVVRDEVRAREELVQSTRYHTDIRI